MSIVQLAILIIVLVAVAAVVAWFLRQSNIAIPEPFLYALYALIAILAIMIIANLAGLGPPVVRL